MNKQPSISQGFAGEVIVEMKKVSWPKRKDTIKLTLIVIGISLIIGLYIGIIDVLLTKGLELATKIR